MIEVLAASRAHQPHRHVPPTCPHAVRFSASPRRAPCEIGRARVLRARAASSGATDAETEVSEGYRPDRDRAPGRGRDHRVQPRQGPRRHRLHRPAARPREHLGLFAPKAVARHRRGGAARSRASPPPTTAAGLAEPALLVAASRPTSTSSIPWDLPVERGDRRWREPCEAAALRRRPAHHQLRGRDASRPSSRSSSSRNIARLRRRLSRARATASRCAVIAARGRRDAARRLVHVAARPPRDLARPRGRRATCRRARALRAAGAPQARQRGRCRCCSRRRSRAACSAHFVSAVSGGSLYRKILVPARQPRASRSSRRSCRPARAAASAGAAGERLLRRRGRGHARRATS